MATATNTNDHLTVSQTTSIAVTGLIRALGGLDNIKATTSSINVLNVLLHDEGLVDYDELKRLGVKGLFLSGHKLKMVVGDDAAVVGQLIDVQKQQHPSSTHN